LLTAYLLFARGRAKDETSIREDLPHYATVYDSSLRESGNPETAADALRKQLERDVEALARVGIEVEVEGSPEGRRYRIAPGGFSPVELDLTTEERSVLVKAVRALSRDFPYFHPLHIALANLIGTVSQAGDGGEPFTASLSSHQDEAIALRIGRLENALSRRKRVRFEYYSISRDETREMEVEPYMLSLLDGIWYVTGRDVQREAVRQFRLSRIKGGIKFATRRESGDYEIPENFERRFVGPRAPWQLGEPDRTARIRLSGEGMKSLTRDRFRWAGTFGRDERGAIFITRYSGERQLAGWVLSLGEEAHVLAPDSLKQRVLDGLQKLAATHGEEPS
jgi:predicted DNA-binding transcriptional regulator YafY